MRPQGRAAPGPPPAGVQGDRQGRITLMSRRMPTVEIVTASAPEQVEDAREIFREYAAGLGVDLCFQNFEAELAEVKNVLSPIF